MGVKGTMMKHPINLQDTKQLRKKRKPAEDGEQRRGIFLRQKLSALLSRNFFIFA